MKIEKTFEEGHQAKLVVEFEPQILETSKIKAAKSIAKRIKIPGFRPGKAPFNVIQKQVGDAAIIEGAIEIIIDDMYPKVIEEADIEPYGPGALEEVTSMDPPIFQFMVPLSPEVNLGKYREIRIDFEEKGVEQKDIDEVINNLKDQQAVIEPVDREVQEGDMVYITLSGEKIGDSEEESSSLINEQRYPVVVEKEDSDQTSEWPFPGFSRNLIDLKANAELKLEHTFEDDYVYEELQGIKAEYSFKIEEIKSRTLPIVDDEFAKSSGDYENLEKMLDEIKNSLKERFDQETNSEYESKIIDQVTEMSEVKFPAPMLGHEIEHYIDDLSSRLSAQGLNMEIYLNSRDLDLEGLKAEISPSAEERLKRGLVLMEIATSEDIKLTSEEIENKTEETIKEIKTLFPEEQIKQLTTGAGLQNLVTKIINDEITARTLDRLRKIAKGEKIEESEKEPIDADSEVNIEDESSDDSTANPQDEAPPSPSESED